MNESKITTIFKGEFVMVDMVDETIELTVENNVYSYSESYGLLDELQKACDVSRKAKMMTTYSQEMQDELEPIDKDSEIVRWMTEGTNPHMTPRSDCG